MQIPILKVKNLLFVGESDDDDDDDDDEEESLSKYEGSANNQGLTRIPHELPSENLSQEPGLPSTDNNAGRVSKRPQFLQNLSVDVQGGEVETENERDTSVHAVHENVISRDNHSNNKSTGKTKAIVKAESPSARAIATKAITALSKGSHALLNATRGGLSAAAGAVMASGEAYIDRHRRAADRMYRKQNGIVGLRDGLLHIAGSMTHLPLVDRQWYVGVFPRGAVSSGILSNSIMSTTNFIGGGKATAFMEVDSKTTKASNASLFGERVSKKDLNEHCQSHTGYPFSPQSFAHLSFHMHMTDLDRYEDMEIVLFLETLGSIYAPSAAKTNFGNNNNHNNGSSSGSNGNGSKPNTPTSSRGKDDISGDKKTAFITKAEGAANAESIALRKANSFFTPAFYGVLSIDCGAAFGPTGGRAHLKLRPNVDALIKLPKSKQLLQLDGIGIIATLIPVALPPTSLLQSFRGVAKPQPCYPSVLIEGSLLTPGKVNTSPLNSAVMALGSFRDRIIVSSRHQGAAPGCMSTTLGEPFSGHWLHWAVINWAM